MSKRYDSFLRNEWWLYQEYWEESRNARQIAEMVGCTSSTVLRSLRRLGIKVKTLSEMRKGVPKGSRFPELKQRDWLYQKYWIEELSTYKIANILNCFSSTVVHALKREGMALRTYSEAHKGEKAYLYGKHRSEEVKEKIRKAKKGKHFSEEHKRKLREARIHQRIPRHKTVPEQIFEDICKRNNLPFHYVGDGQLWIGKSKRLNPDFIEVNGKKICVEIMGAYWHSPLLNQNLREDASLEYRKRHYRHYKWTPVFVWDTDLVRKDAEQFVLNELRREEF